MSTFLEKYRARTESIFIEIDGKSVRVTGGINHFKRYQTNLLLEDLFPTRNGICCCGCETPLKGKQRRWASPDCNSRAMCIYGVIVGNSDTIRTQLYYEQKGYCQHCGLLTDDWQADHIIPVHKGGGATGLWNFQTLCIDCHKKKSKADLKLKQTQSALFVDTNNMVSVT